MTPTSKQSISTSKAPLHQTLENKPLPKPETSNSNEVINSNLSAKDAFNLGLQYTQQASTSSNTYDLDKAVNYIQYSAATGYAEAQFKLGLMYFQGIGVQSSPAIGFYWIEKAANNNLPEAQVYLAYMYKKGIGAPVNLFKSDYWLKQAQYNGIEVNLDALSLM